MAERDARGRFTVGNSVSSAGGAARAAKLSDEERRAIALQGLQAIADERFDGDLAAAQRWLAEQGAKVRRGLKRPRTNFKNEFSA